MRAWREYHTKDTTKEVEAASSQESTDTKTRRNQKRPWDTCGKRQMDTTSNLSGAESEV